MRCSPRSATGRIGRIGTAALLCAALLGACGGHPGRATTGAGAAPAVGTIDSDDHGCANDWVAPTSGPTTFTVTNHSSTTMEIELQGVQDRRVYARVEILPPGVTRPASAVLSPGSYAWRCVGTSGSPRISQARSVTGPAVAGRSYLPVGQNEILIPLVQFRNTTATGLAQLSTATHALRTAADQGASNAALRLYWVVAHLGYESLGGAYDLFGSWDARINGRPDGLPGGVTDPGWTGFGRLEYALWHNQPGATVKGIADQLDAYVAALQKAFPIEDGNTNDLTIRAHEILENALQFELNAENDQGSHTNLANVQANITAARSVVDTLAPLLTPRDPQLLATARTDLTRLAALVGQYHTSSGWLPVQSLLRAQREPLNGLMSQTVEDLAAIPAILTVDKHADE